MSSADLWVLAFGAAVVVGLLIGLVAVGKYLRRRLLPGAVGTRPGRAMEALMALQAELLREGSGVGGSDRGEGPRTGTRGGPEAPWDPGPPESIDGGGVEPRP